MAPKDLQARLPNIIFIIIDALRARNLSCYGYKYKISSNIDKIADKGVLFRQAFSCINATDPSLTSIFSGKYPISTGLISHGFYVTKWQLMRVRRVIFLPQILKHMGYRTYALDWLGRWHKKGYDYYMGIGAEKFSKRPKVQLNFKARKKSYITSFLLGIYRYLDICISGAKNMMEDGQYLTDLAINIIKFNHRNNRKFFLFIHYWDVHGPYFGSLFDVFRYYDLRDLRFERLTLSVSKQIKNPGCFDILCKTGPTLNLIKARYDAAIHKVDLQIGRLLRLLEELGMVDETFIIITSDHGESLGEHGIFFDHHGLYDVSIHVPLILTWPERFDRKQIDALVQHVDVMPTILKVLGVDPKVFKLQGKDLSPLINGEVDSVRQYVFVEEAHTQRKRAIRTKKWKYIKTLSKKGAICRYCGIMHGDYRELYDLRSDPDEKQNIIKDREDVAQRLDDQMHKFIINLIQI